MDDQITNVGSVVGKRIDAAMEAIERNNPKLKGNLPTSYGRPTIYPAQLGGLIDLVRAGLLEAPWAYRESFRMSGSAGPDADR